MPVVKFNAFSQNPPNAKGPYFLSVLGRTHNFSEAGKKIDVPEYAKLNTLIVNVANSEGKVTERQFLFHGQKIVLSDYQRRIHTPGLINEIAKIGAESFKETDELQVAEFPKEYVIRERDYITANDFFAYHHCPHRVWRDQHINPDERDAVNPFIQLLWERGIQHEREVVEDIGEYEVITGETEEEKAENTIKAMERKVPLIYHGLLRVDELKGEPDILQLQGDGTYRPVEIKAAMAFEGMDEGFDTGKMKEYYAMQLCLYTDALIRLGFAEEHVGVILDKDKNEVVYELDAPRNKRDKTTFWELYHKLKPKVLALIQNKEQNDPALGSICKVCHHYSSCRDWVYENDHTSRVYKIGRSASDRLRDDAGISTVHQLADTDIDSLLARKGTEGAGGDGKQFLHGLAAGKLEPMIRRAQYLVSGAQGVKILEPDAIKFPKTKLELHIDLESDPTQDFIYLHGVVLRRVTDKKYYPYNGPDENVQFIPFIANEVTPEAEERAVQEFWNFVRSIEEEYTVYHYSHYEKTTYRQLFEKYPSVVSKEELDAFFSGEHCVDLYKIVDKYTDWPTDSYGLKPLAKHIGFEWRIENSNNDLGEAEKASGAASIKWFNEWVKAQKEGKLSKEQIDKMLQKILLYNEDDCMATVVLKDYLEIMNNLEQSLKKSQEEPSKKPVEASEPV